MGDVIFRPFGKQANFLLSKARRRGAFAGKRGGKTEVGAIASIKLQEEKPNLSKFGLDPYMGAIIAPTFPMLRRLSLKKFRLYAKPFEKGFNKTDNEITWHDGTTIIGLSADKPERIEGLKLAWIWIDEVFQVSEELFLECRARVADTQGYLILTGSLGVQFVNPKAHWAYKYFKEQIDAETECFEWSTADNPYFPKEEIEDLKNTLDAATFRAMFEINWDVVPKTAVYSDWDDGINVQPCAYNPNLPCYVSIDWGWAHPMAVGFFQYDKKKDHVFMIDEIVQSKLKLERLGEMILAKPYVINGWICDIAGDQEREQTGKSNIKWFEENLKVTFKKRTSAINYGVAIVRSYIKNAKGQARFFVDPRCKKTLDGLKQYRYPEKNGEISNENPVKENDDAVDMLRYYFVNMHDPKLDDKTPTVTNIKRLG